MSSTKIIAAICSVISFASIAGASALDRMEKVSGVEIQQTLSGDAIQKGQKSGPATVTFNVWSGGCTHDSDFSINLTQNDANQVLTIVRNNPDNCEDVIHFQSITLPVSGVVYEKSLLVANPVAINAKWSQ